MKEQEVMKHMNDQEEENEGVLKLAQQQVYSGLIWGQVLNI